LHLLMRLALWKALMRHHTSHALDDSVPFVFTSYRIVIARLTQRVSARHIFGWHDDVNDG
jgi:hypothetical protein